MSHQVCHAHCPGGGSGLGAGALVAAGSAGAAISAVAGEIIWTASIVMVVALVVSVAVLIHVLRRDRPVITGRPAVRSLAEVAELRLVSVADASAVDGHYQRALPQRSGRAPGGTEVPGRQAARKAP